MPKKNKKDIIIGNNNNKTTLIFCHGLGDSPTSWIYFSNFIKKYIKDIKVILLCAENNPVTVNNGFIMPCWFDMLEIPISTKTKNSEKYIQDSLNKIDEIINKEIQNNVSLNNIFLGGFSQGAALSFIYLQYKKQYLGGILMLSGWMLNYETLQVLKKINNKIPIFIGHGTSDDVVLYENAFYLNKLLNENRFPNITFKSYDKMKHNISNKEIYDIIDWMNNLIK